MRSLAHSRNGQLLRGREEERLGVRRDRLVHVEQGLAHEVVVISDPLIRLSSKRREHRSVDTNGGTNVRNERAEDGTEGDKRGETERENEKERQKKRQTETRWTSKARVRERARETHRQKETGRETDREKERDESQDHWNCLRVISLPHGTFTGWDTPIFVVLKRTSVRMVLRYAINPRTATKQLKQGNVR